MKKIILILSIINLILFVSAQEPDGSEMRGVWITTAKNIDYPSKKNLSPEEQKKEFIEILDMYEKININAVFVQVRPSSDAFYFSEIEPWSEWLNGKQGKAPNPYYDPLKFMIEESHKRNMEFHAWINPFRAVATVKHADISSKHISKQKPKWCFTYNVNKYLNPGIPEVRDYVTSVILDIVERYDIDGIHFDDYFYPYPKKKGNGEFMEIPDFKTYKKYNKKFDNIKDWRRDNMSKFIRQVNESIKEIKSDVKFGLAPSAVWRNKRYDPEGSDTRGFAHYDYLYADVLKWLREGWIDYVTPQLYVEIGNKYADYKILIDWWSKHTYGRHLYIGQSVYKANPKSSYPAWRNPSELPKQMRINRKSPKVLGSIFYKTKSFQENLMGFNDTLRTNFYATFVPTPKMSWLEEPVAILDTIIIAEDKTAPPSPYNFKATKLGRQYMLSWKAPKVSEKGHDDKAVSYTIYKYRKINSDDITEENIYKKTEKNHIFIKRRRFAFFKKKFKFVVTASDKAGNESKISEEIIIKLKNKK